MMHAVIRNSHDTIHLIGHVDPYNLESLRDHVKAMARHGDVSLVISITPAEEKALETHAGRWLTRLANSGVAVMVRSGPDPLGVGTGTRAA